MSDTQDDLFESLVPVIHMMSPDEGVGYDLPEVAHRLKCVQCKACPVSFLVVSWLPHRADGYCSEECFDERRKPKRKVPRPLRGGTYQDRHGRKIGQKLADVTDEA